jgi:sugar/nucleoside kinase (ribokinase family)
LQEILKKKMNLLGMGNALIDVLAKLENDNLLQDLHLPKGSMSLVDEPTRTRIFDKISGLHLKMTTGGSVGNTTKALAKLKVPVGFIGKLGEDEHAAFYMSEFAAAGVNNHFIQEPGKPSGSALALISPDGERTFGTYLGVAAELSAQEIEASVIQQYTHFYMEGYLVQNHELIENTLRTAKALGLTTAIDLASYNVVEAEKTFIHLLIDKYVDIVFANEEEAKALTGKEPEEAAREMAERVQIAVVKAGPNGSYVVSGTETIHVPVEKMKPVDSTAAGDYYAAGFFYGLSQGHSLKQSAEWGSLLATEIIQVVGTHLPEATWQRIQLALNN